MLGFYERRSGRDRRDWNVFTHPDRRVGGERRSGKDRRISSNGYDGVERRRRAEAKEEPPSAETSPPTTPAPEKPYYSTAEVAEMTGLSQSTLLLWIRNKVIDGSRVKRSGEGKRLWTIEDIEEIRRIKLRNGWTE